MIGTSENLSIAQLGAMADAVSDLRRMLGAVVSSALDATAGNFVLGADSVNQAALSFANTMKVSVDQLDAERAQVESGQRAFASWASFANDLHLQLADQLHEQQSWGLTPFLTGVAASTAGGIEDLADKVGTGLKFGVPLLAVILVALVVLRW